jgi:exodeoxyribonuclease VII small subunit
MSDSPGLDSSKFNKNYKILKETADWLSQQKEPDIDQLVPKVERAMQAYQICKDRLAKVEETLGQYFENKAAPEEPEAPAREREARKAGRAQPPPDGEAEIAPTIERRDW